MKIKKDFVLRQIAGKWVILPLADGTKDFSAMLTLNDTGAALWRVLEKTPEEEALVAALLDEYEVTEAQARADVSRFLDKLVQIGCIEYEN